MVQEQVKAEEGYEASQKERKKRHSAPAAPRLVGNSSAPSPTQKITLPGSSSVRHTPNIIVGM